MDARRRGRGGKREVHDEPTSPQSFTLATAEPEASLFQLLQEVVEPGRIVPRLEGAVVHLHGEVKDGVAIQGFHLIVGIRLGGPTVLIQLDPHAQIEEVLPGITRLLQTALDTGHQVFRHGVPIQPLPHLPEQTDVSAGTRFPNKGIHQGFGGPGDFPGQRYQPL